MKSEMWSHLVRHCGLKAQHIPAWGNALRYGMWGNALRYGMCVTPLSPPSWGEAFALRAIGDGVAGCEDAARPVPTPQRRRRWIWITVGERSVTYGNEVGRLRVSTTVKKNRKIVKS